MACLLMGCAIALSACQGEAAPPGPVGTPFTGSPSAAPTTPMAIQDGSLPLVAQANPPVRLQIPALRLNARVNPVGIDAGTGDFAVPPSVDEVGWYQFGPSLASPMGSIVIAGHVDSAAEGKGAFFELRNLAPGDEIVLTAKDGSVRRFTVSSREQFEKTALPADLLFARDGQLRLTLITCGGPFDRTSRHYRDNVVVTALP